MEEEYLGVFLHNKAIRTTTCTMCNSNFKQFNKYNLKRHYEICIRKHQGPVECEGSIARKIHHISLTATTREIVVSCLKIVTIHGKPFRVLNSVGFTDLFKPVSLGSILFL